MKQFRWFILILSVLFLVGSLNGPLIAAKDKAPDQVLDHRMNVLRIDELFADTEGTTVIKHLKTGKLFVYNKKRSFERFTPESTFKVPNALIGLQTEAVRDEYDVKRWDGVVREIEDWNRDHTLGSGMRYSVIWYYQDMARDIGTDQMQRYVKAIRYGNRDISGGIDQFWLDSSLKISAHEQIRFMEKLVEEDLPFDKQIMRTVKRIMINEEADSYMLHGKTGTRLSDMGLGWYVGYVETMKGDWVFATNIDGSGSDAKSITLKVLEQLKIIADE